MAKQVQRRRGTATQNDALTGAVGEVTVDTTNDSLRVHDGSTAGGIQTMRVDMDNYDGTRVTGTFNVTGLDVSGNAVVDGSLGIGTSSPTTPTHITKSDLSGFVSRTAATLTLENSGDTELYLASLPTNTGQIRFGDTGGNFRGAISYDHSSDAFLHYTNGTERLRIDSSGRVGIGTSSPEAKLHVNDNTTVIGNGSSGYATINFHSASTGSARYASIRKNYDSPYDMRIRASNSSGEAPLIFETSSATERMRIDSSGNLLVGTTDNTLYNNGAGGETGIALRPNLSLDVTRSGGATLNLNRLDSDGEIVDFRKNGTTVGSIGTGGGDLNIGTGDTRIRFNDATDNLIPLNAGNGYRDASISLGDSGARFKDLHLSGVGYINTIYSALNLTLGADEANDSSTGNSNILFKTDGTEKARLDSSGNVLVGTTSFSTTTAGIKLDADGDIAANRDGGAAAFFGRLTSDGDIAVFRKNGSTVGSIGTYSGGIDLAGSSRGIRLTGSSFFPVTNAGSVSDNTTNLGYSGGRFKDLYLSGGAYLGGTGSANKLDDYEEGTFTPVIQGATTAGTFTYGTQSGLYTKIGNAVSFHIAINVTATSTSAAGAVTIQGLPFTASGSFQSLSVGWVQGITFADQLSAYAPNSESFVVLRNSVSAATGSQIAGSNLNTTFWIFVSGTYRA